jgi:hypothetical protein
MRDVAVEVTYDGTRRPYGVGFEPSAETPCDLARRPDGSGALTVDVYRLSAESARRETDMGRQTFVALRTVTET